MPKISVLMSVYNGEDTIEESIRSILNQTYKDFELVIIDDGSTDNTIEEINKFKDNRIRLYRLKKNYGVGYALNFGLKKTKGKYIAKADADDINEQNRFEIQSKYLDMNPHIALVASYIDFFPDNDDVKRTERYRQRKSIVEKQIELTTTSVEISREIYKYCCITHSTIMVRSNIIKKIDYDPNLRMGEDYKLFYQMNKLGFLMEKIPKRLVKVRVSNRSTSAIEAGKFAKAILNFKREEFENFLQGDNRNNIIWGAGGFGESLMKELEANGRKSIIFCFVDSNKKKWGNELYGLKINPPNQINRRKNKVIVASTYGRAEIVKLLEYKGFRFMRDYFVLS